jgi:type VI secretion system protein ImpM
VNAAVDRHAGFYGKIPSLGDFCGRNLPPEFVNPWDNWLRAALGQVRRSITDDLVWREMFLTSPVWRFVLAAGLCGPSGWTGVIGPGSDRVGRFFPMTIVLPLDPEADVARLIVDWHEGYRAAEDLLLATLDNHYDADTLAAAAEGLRLTLPLPRRSTPAGNRFPSDHPMVQVPLTATGERYLGAAIATAAAQSGLLPYSLWWHVGWGQAEPSAVVCAGLPDPPGFKAFLGGSWSGGGWQPSERPR